MRLRHLEITLWSMRALCRAGLVAGAIAALSMAAADGATAEGLRGTLVVRDTHAAHVQVAEGTLAWMHLTWSGTLQDWVPTLRSMELSRLGRGARPRDAKHLPSAFIRQEVDAYGDLGIDQAGRPVQVIPQKLPWLWNVEEPFPKQTPIWAYDIRQQRARPLRLPSLGSGCRSVTAGVWHSRVALAAQCDTDAVVYAGKGASLRPVFRQPDLDRNFDVVVSLDLSANAIGLRLWVEPCATAEAGHSAAGASPEGCVGRGGTMSAWLLRDGCAPSLLVQSKITDPLPDLPHVGDGSVYWLEHNSIISRQARVILRARRLRPDCRLGPTTVALRLPVLKVRGGFPPKHEASAAISGNHLVVARWRKGIERYHLGR